MHESSTLSHATRVGENCAAKAGEGNLAVEIVLKHLTHARARKRPVKRESNSPYDAQRQNHDAGYSEPPPMNPVCLPVLLGIVLFNDGCVTLGHCVQKSAKAGQ
jgi:hypothetical protein